MAQRQWIRPRCERNHSTDEARGSDRIARSNVEVDLTVNVYRLLAEVDPARRVIRDQPVRAASLQGCEFDDTPAAGAGNRA